MAPSDGPVDVSQELAKLRHEKNNQEMRGLPSNAKIQRRPLSHAPVASPFAGAAVEKVIYVSRRTPVMSAVKRVKKFLRQIENRAHQGFGMLGKNDRDALSELAAASEKLKKSSEEVVVKASGRAMEQALRIGEWFRTREDEMLCRVEVRTNSVAAIDDIVEEDEHDLSGADTPNATADKESTTMEGVRNADQSPDDAEKDAQEVTTIEPHTNAKQKEGESIVGRTTSKRKRQKRKRQTYDKDDLPEARLRWVKTVEVAISLRG